MEYNDEILKILKEVITPDRKRLLEFYIGPNNFAKFFAHEFKNLEWVSTNISNNDIPKLTCDLIFTANTFHQIEWKDCKSWMKMLGTRLREGSQVFIFDTFNESGFRSTNDVTHSMIKHGFALYKDYELPANKHVLVYTRLIFMKDEIKKNK
jgi:hypothetical protein